MKKLLYFVLTFFYASFAIEPFELMLLNQELPHATWAPLFDEQLPFEMRWAALRQFRNTVAVQDAIYYSMREVVYRFAANPRSVGTLMVFTWRLLEHAPKYTARLEHEARLIEPRRLLYETPQANL
jgi:hypothetical protein